MKNTVNKAKDKIRSIKPQTIITVTTAALAAINVAFAVQDYGWRTDAVDEKFKSV